MNTSARTGANQLLDLAREYDLPLETVYCYAWRIKRLALAKDGGMIIDYWGETARNDIHRLLQSRANECLERIVAQVRAFLIVQGSLAAC